MSTPKPKTRPFWIRRQYLINPRVQIEVIGYLILLFGLAFGILVALVRFMLNGMNSELQRLDPQHAELIQMVFQVQNEAFNRLLLASSVVTILVVFAGGILISHRLVGPIHRLKIVLQQLIDNKVPDTLNCRKSDFHQDVFVLLKTLVAKINESNV